MKRSNTQPLKQVIHEYVEALKMKGKLREVSLVSKWERLMGGTISRATREIYIKDRILYVYLNSSVVRNELLNIKEPLIERLNQEAHSSVIDDIVLK
ncbi:MAG: DUF721 domain-containing protein [Salinivirgaceae bacterium]|jgi:uncharacterized protein with ACT and thioredoxin-like domain|nr:DUF721 domain-containing protein [Salinivirgaceae bacterium]